MFQLKKKYYFKFKNFYNKKKILNKKNIKILFNNILLKKFIFKYNLLKIVKKKKFLRFRFFFRKIRHNFYLWRKKKLYVQKLTISKIRIRNRKKKNLNLFVNLKNFWFYLKQ